MSAPLSKSQYGLYVECMAHQGEVYYNIPFCYVLDGSLDGERLRRAIEATVAAHPTLFTHIELTDDGDPIQTIDDTEPLALEVEHTTDVETVRQGFVQPFDLMKDRLFRIRLLTNATPHSDHRSENAEHYYLLLDIHHIIGDGTTLRVLLADIEKAYLGEAPEKEELTLGEVAAKEDEVRKTPVFEEDRQWYAEHFDCGDCYSPLLPDLEGDVDEEGLLTCQLDVEPSQVETFCKANGIYKSTFFTAAYAYLLAKFNNEQEVLFNTIHNGRTDKRLAHTVAMLVRTFPVYAKFSDDTTVMDFLKNVQEQMTGCRQHEAYAYSDVVADLGLQVATQFAWHGTLFDTERLCGKPMSGRMLMNDTRGGDLYLKVYCSKGNYYVDAEYSANKYSEALVRQFVESYEAVVGGFLTNERLCDIGIASESQVALLDSFNQTDVPYDDSQTIVSLFSQQAQNMPDKTALVFKDKRFTYKEVDEISDRIARYISSKGLGAEDFVAILIPRCEWMALASLGVLKAGCAFLPLDPGYPKERLSFMIQDTGTRMLIADEELRPIVDDYQGEVILTKDLMNLQDAGLVPTPPSPHNLFTLIYTSGSTGQPKGGQTEHRNWVAFCHMHQQNLGITKDSRVAAYASFGFDASPMEMFGALTIGAELHIIPEELRLDLLALNDYLEANGITHTFMTTQVAYQFATSVDNHSLHALTTGGEKLSALTPPTSYVLINGYGPSETICYVTSHPVKERLQNIPIGKAMQNCKLYIVDRQGRRLPVGACGELWIAGPQVGRGYLNRPEKTAEVFIPNPFTDETNATPHSDHWSENATPHSDHWSEKYSRIYKTGDIVRYLPDGNLQFVGRRDGQVKIRGFRIELKEVESVVREFPGIKDATVQAFDDPNGGKFIAAYIVSDEQVDIDALNNFILDQKPPYMVPAVTMQIDTIPLNQNQKVNKRALPKPEKKVAAQEESHVPMNVLEQELKDMVATIVGHSDFGLTTILGYAGLTSITAIKLAVQVNKKYGAALDSKNLAKNFTLQTIENKILEQWLEARDRKAEVGMPSDISPQRLASYPLSYAQTGVYVECIKQPFSTVYNIPAKITFPKDTDIARLADAVKEVVNAHPQLSVCFDMENGTVVQKVRTDMPVEVSTAKMSEAELDAYKQEFVKPFNLNATPHSDRGSENATPHSDRGSENKGPLYRLEIVQTEQQTCLLMDIHHLVADGASIDLMLSQLCAILNGHSIEAEHYTYAQHVADQKAAEDSPDYTAAKAFFEQQLSGCEEVTEVPADLTNPVSQGVTATVSSPFDLKAAEQFCREHEITPAALTLAAVYYTLSRFTNNEQVTLTTISNGRSDVRIADTVGMFVNTLAMSTKIGAQRVIDFLHTVSDQFESTLQHENYPFAQIATDYGLSAEIMFAYQIGVLNRYAVGSEELEIENLELNVPKFQVAFYIQEHEGRPAVTIDYDNGRYSEGMMQSMADGVVTAIQAFRQNPDAGLLQTSLLNEEQQIVLDRFNQTDVPYDDSQTIVSLFRRQAALHPDHIAVVYGERCYTYAQVDDISERLATYIASKGLGVGDVVSILIPRSEWMAIASIGVLKAGCAYQPLDPSYPSERLNFMMQDADAKLLIADGLLRSLVNEYGGEVLLTRDIESLPISQCSPIHPITPGSLFILLYTSGSTGVPKGVMLEHRNLVAFCHWYQRYYGLTAHDRVAAYASYGFDASMMDMYPALTCGAAVYIIGEDIRMNLPELNDYFNTMGITHSFMTTQVGYQFATNVDNHSLRHFSVGGEKLSALQPPANYMMHNGYGPTECTIFTTTYPLDHYEQDIPIGKPVDNMKLYIVDKDFNRLPLGAMGELWINGPQVGRGYLNQPEKTAETFIDSSFGRVYRTGDIVRYLPDGNIQFVGRRDGQVKIRGFRIELKEVEAVVREYPGIKDATVQAFEYTSGGKFIAAYIVSDEQVDINALNKFIGQKKPPYMVPAATMQIDAIPLNQNQKVNRKALPEPVIHIDETAYVEPANELEALFCRIFGNILDMERFSATDNFFELGGTSLMATRVIIEADKANRHIAYGDVFANPTPRQLAAFLNKDTQENSSDSPDAQFDYTPINTLLMGNTLDNFRQGERQSIGRVLLTGATGYLGIHVLKELIERDDVPAIYCLVRAEDASKAEQRLKRLLFYYFAKNYKELFGTRLLMIPGDVTDNLNHIVGEMAIDTVFNCAAVVKHFSAGTEIEDVNIGGTMNCISLCIEKGARLIHISTYSTAGMSVDGKPSPDVVQTEQKLYYGQYMDNRYVHSKFVAERSVLEAVALHGLSAKVMRVGNLAPRSTDGEFQINFQTNSAMGRVRVFKVLGCYPYEMTDMPVEFSPINEVATAIVTLAETPRECCLFHPFNNHSVLFGDVLAGLQLLGDAPRQVESEEFHSTMEAAKSDPQKTRFLQSLVAYQDMAHGQQSSQIETSNVYTTQVLYRMGFHWSPTSWDYVFRFLTAIDGMGYFEK